MKLSHSIALALLATASCNATHQITFAAIENYINKPQPHSYIDYQSFEALSKHASGLFSAEQRRLQGAGRDVEHSGRCDFGSHPQVGSRPVVSRHRLLRDGRLGDRDRD